MLFGRRKQPRQHEDGWTQELYDEFRKAYVRNSLSESNILFCIHRVQTKFRLENSPIPDEETTFFGRITANKDSKLSTVPCRLHIVETLIGDGPDGKPINLGALWLSETCNVPMVHASIKVPSTLVETMKSLLTNNKIFGNDILPVWIWFDHSFLIKTEVVSEAQSKCTHIKWISFQQSLDLRGRSSQDDMLIG
jgi:hypothetical protein